MEMDWEDWHGFLEMLSVDGTRPFVVDLELPFNVERFVEMQRMARACLEAYMYTSVRTPEGHTPGLIEAWAAYRDAGGILSDAELEGSFARYGHSDELARGIYTALEEWIGKETSHALCTWFLEGYRPIPDPLWQWPMVLRRIFTDDWRRILPASDPPIGEEAQARVAAFSVRYETKKRELEEHFWRLNQEAPYRDTPTLWERVLQTFIADGPITDPFYLDDIRSCLWYKLIRAELANLARIIGPETMAELAQWVILVVQELKPTDPKVEMKIELPELPQELIDGVG